MYSAQPANVDTVLVDGRVLLRRSQPTRWDSTDIVRRATASMRALARRHPLP
ncbi:hypothetical protein D3C87_2127160 [compost metagenome]